MTSMPFASKSPKGKGNNRETTLNRETLIKRGQQSAPKPGGEHSANSTLNRPSALKRQLMQMNGMNGKKK